MIVKILNLKIIFVLLIVGLFYLATLSISFAADRQPYDVCTPNVDTCKPDQGLNYSCLPAKDPSTPFLCQPDPFGKVQPPDALKGFLTKDSTGASAISQFLSNAIVLIYSVAGIVFIFMIIWGAFGWMTSGGDKEAMASAQKRIINAFIGIILFAVAFAIIRVIGQFTGFTFFAS